MIDGVPPALILMGGALLAALLRGRPRDAVFLIAPLATLWAVWQVPDGVVMTTHFLGYAIEPLEGSPLRRLFAATFAIAAIAGTLFAFRQAKWYELSAAHLYAAGAIGVCFAGDLITLFLFWELMVIFSTVVVWCGGDAAARAAGLRYAIIHLLGGVILKVGIEGIKTQTGSIDLQPIPLETFTGWLVLIGILINVAAPPLSAWLADAYPKSSPTGSVFLSVFTTKTGVLALILLFPGEGVLIPIGLFMIFYGIVYALLENDVRRILAYSIVNQVGFMVCAVGIGTELALNGAAAHASAHVIVKALLFMSAGVVVYRTGQNRVSNLGGLYLTMPITAICGIVGAMTLAGLPLTAGFTTQTMTAQAALVEGMTTVYFLLAAASAGVFLYAGVRFPWLVYFQETSDRHGKDAPWNMGAAMIVLALACILLGVIPGPFYGLLPHSADYVPYTAPKVFFYLQLLTFSGLAFVLLMRRMPRSTTITLDVDWLWRRGLPWLWFNTANGIAALRARATRALFELGRGIGTRLLNALNPYGALGRSWQIGTTALWVAMMLTLYVMLYYV